MVCVGLGALEGVPRPLLGSGDGILGTFSSFKGDEAGFCLAIPGAVAVFILEYGENFFFCGRSLSGVLACELHPSSLYPNSL